MKVRCINAKNFKNLTLDKVYDVIENSEGFYLIVSNAGLTTKYSEDYFEVEEEVIQPQPQPVLPEYNIVITKKSTGLQISVDEDNIMFDVYSGTAGSCGIISLHGLNTLFNKLKSNIDKFEKVILAIINEYKGKYAMIIFSTNYKQHIWEIMDRIADISTEEIINPNSKLAIKTWIIYTNKE